MPLADDAQTMLDALNASFPRVEEMTGADARAAVLARKRLSDNPERVGSVEDLVIDGPGGALPLRVYQPLVVPHGGPRPAVVFAHGGGFVFCDLDTHDELCRTMANAVGAVVVSVDYRLAPEHHAPAAAQDVYAALAWTRASCAQLHADPARIIVAGDSAGGNLAAVTALMARDLGGPALAAQVLIYPVIGDDFATPSYLEFAEGHFNTRAAMRWYWEQYAPGGTSAAAEPHRVSPILASTLAGLPPAVVLTAACDPLDSEGSAYADRLREDGVPTIHRRHDGIFHGFLTIPSLAITGRARAQLWADLAVLIA
ncbi:alpha/beta hydrolase [Tomitella biformata]|uniref:alpha/beta hydrolase n=1 Tax=Tomitella biformata TaxID=630403 RepID=UPI000465DDF8|nr:alpha/beta hydrolase [Tomitella biformata]